MIVRYSTESDLPKIESHYGRLDNSGDPFCDVNSTQGVRFDWLIIAEVAGEYAGFLYWHLGEKPFLRSQHWKVCPYQRSPSLRKVPRTGSRERADGLCLGEAESLWGHGTSFLQQLRPMMQQGISTKALGSRSSGSRYTTLLESMITERMARNRNPSPIISLILPNHPQSA